MLLSLAWETFKERKKYLLPWGAGLVLVALGALLFRPGIFIPDGISLMPDGLTSLPASGIWPGEFNFDKFLLFLLLTVYLVVFAVFEGSYLITASTSRDNLALFLTYPLPRWKMLTARLVYLLGIGLSSVVLVNVLGIVAVLLLPGQLNGLSAIWQGFKLVLLEMGFAVFAALIATLTKRTWIGFLAGIGVVICMLAAFLLPVWLPDSGWVQWASPFFYYFPSTLPVFGQFAALFGGLVIGLAGLGYVFESADLD